MLKKISRLKLSLSNNIAHTRAKLLVLSQRNLLMKVQIISRPFLLESLNHEQGCAFGAHFRDEAKLRIGKNTISLFLSSSQKIGVTNCQTALSIRWAFLTKFFLRPHIELNVGVIEILHARENWLWKIFQSLEKSIYFYNLKNTDQYTFHPFLFITLHSFLQQQKVSREKTAKNSTFFEMYSSIVII